MQFSSVATGLITSVEYSLHHFVSLHDSLSLSLFFFLSLSFSFFLIFYTQTLAAVFNHKPITVCAWVFKYTHTNTHPLKVSLWFNYFCFYLFSYFQIITFIKFSKKFSFEIRFSLIFNNKSRFKAGTMFSNDFKINFFKWV